MSKQEKKYLTPEEQKQVFSLIEPQCKAHVLQMHKLLDTKIGGIKEDFKRDIDSLKNAHETYAKDLREKVDRDAIELRGKVAEDAKELKEKVDTDAMVLREKVTEDAHSLKEMVKTDAKNLKEKVDTESKRVNDKIDVLQSKIEIRLDGVDESLRGNGRIGLYEQVRSLKWQLRAVYVCLLLLFGFKMWGLTVNEWYKLYVPKNTDIIQVDKHLSSQPSTEPVSMGN